MAEVPGMSSRQRWTLLLVCPAVFMLLLDVTVVSVALPSIQRDLRASLSDLQWVSAAYGGERAKSRYRRQFVGSARLTNAPE